MIVIIQQENNEFPYEFPYEFCYQANEAIRHINWYRNKIVHENWKRSLEDLNYIKLNKPKKVLHVGSIEFIKKVFNGLKLELPKPINIPSELNQYEFLKRKISMGYLKDLRFPCFIKPLNELKLFTGCLLESNKDLSLLIPELKEDTELLISEPINIVSEWRGFVYKGKLVDCKHYSGDFKIGPDYNKAIEMIKSYTLAPVAYTLDIGITDNNETILVEVNDFYSVATYGFGGETYLNMLIDRWKEIVK